MNKILGKNLDDQAKARGEHRRQVIWQIGVPVAGAAVVIIVLAVLASISGTGYSSANQWASISLIYMLLPSLVAGLVVLALTGMFVFGVFWLTRKLPGVFFTARNYIYKAFDYIDQACQAAVRPILAISAAMASLNRLLKTLTTRNEEK